MRCASQLCNRHTRMNIVRLPPQCPVLLFDGNGFTKAALNRLYRPDCDGLQDGCDFQLRAQPVVMSRGLLAASYSHLALLRRFTVNMGRGER